jgi:hypothetical protein
MCIYSAYLLIAASRQSAAVSLVETIFARVYVCQPSAVGPLIGTPLKAGRRVRGGHLRAGALLRHGQTMLPADLEVSGTSRRDQPGGKVGQREIRQHERDDDLHR